MHNNTFDLNLNERPFEAIKNGTKKVEIRANKINSIISKMKIHDTIIFTKSESSEKIRCTIEK